MNPGATEVCNGLDDDCDGAPGGDEVDVDGDGFLACDDCDDGDAAVYPGATEACDGADNDCDGAPGADEVDVDGDGFLACEECDDGDADVFPGGAEVCNGQDDDCDGAPGVDEVDADGDGFLACAECDDGDPAVYPGAPELCNGNDDDCDGSPAADELDGDADGARICDGDCDDGNADVYLGAPELCDGALDNDCDGQIDGNEVDADGDGFDECDGDCDDEDLESYPGATELCDGVDNDCDGVGDALGYWPFDEGSGDVAADQAGLGLDGAIVGATWTTGLVGGALDFDGASSHVVLDHPELRPMDGMTLSVWVNPDVIHGGTWDTIVSHGSSGVYNGCCGDTYFLGYYLSGISWYTGDELEGFNLLHDQTDYQGHVGSWHHLAATWNTDTGERTIYVDGTPTLTDANAPAIPWYDEVPVRIGSDTNNAAPVLFFDGLIDEVKMFDCPLDAGQVAVDFSQNWPW